MQKKILEFATVLRQSGIRVSVSETIDAFQALDELSFADRDVFRDALRASLVKRGDDIPSFDELFNLYWSGYYDNIKQSFDDAVGALGEEGIDVGELMRQLQEQLQGGERGDIDLSDLAKALLTSDLETLESMIRAAAEAAGAARIQNMLMTGKPLRN